MRCKPLRKLDRTRCFLFSKLAANMAPREIILNVTADIEPVDGLVQLFEAIEKAVPSDLPWMETRADSDADDLVPLEFIPVKHQKAPLLSLRHKTSQIGPKCSFTRGGTNSGMFIAAGARLDHVSVEMRTTNSFLYIGPGVRLGRVSIKLVGAGNVIAIGGNTTWESGNLIASYDQNVVIGHSCMFSSVVGIRTSDGHGIFDGETKERINPAKSVIIGGHVWLGSGVRVNKGAYIGSGSVIGQQSVVSGRVEPNSIYAGAPAKVLRSNIRWSRTTEYEDVPEEFR